MKRLTTEEFIEKAKKIHGNKYNYDCVNYINKYTKIKIFCNKCKNWFEQNPRDHLVCKECPCCRKNLQIQTDDFIQRAKKIHGDRYCYNSVNYLTSRVKVKIKCNRCGKNFLQAPAVHLKGSGCPFCGKVIKKTKDEFVKEAKKIHKNKYKYDRVEYKTTHTKVKIFCNTCKRYFWQTPSNHLHGGNCSFCSPNKKLTQEEFIEKAKQVHGNAYDYSKSIYLNHRAKIEIICKRCGKLFKQLVNGHLNGNGCPYCKQSKGEIRIQNWLEKYKVKYEIQKCFKGCKDKKPLPFDFYLPKYNLCIEFQGKQHYEPICRSVNQSIEQAEKAFKLQQKHDKIKKEYCKKNNIAFLEIKHDEDIEKIISSFVSLLQSNM